jgi:hypothetical protein
MRRVRCITSYRANFTSALHGGLGIAGRNRRPGGGSEPSLEEGVLWCASTGGTHSGHADQGEYVCCAGASSIGDYSLAHDDGAAGEGVSPRAFDDDDL